MVQVYSYSKMVKVYSYKKKKSTGGQVLEEDHSYIKSHSGKSQDENPREEVPLAKVSPHPSLPETMPESLA